MNLHCFTLKLMDKQGWNHFLNYQIARAHTHTRTHTDVI